MEIIQKYILAAVLSLLPWSVGAVLFEAAFPIVTMNLSGHGSLPLAYEAGSGTEDYGFVDSSVNVSLSSLGPSQLVYVIDTPNTLTDPIPISLDFELFLQFVFTDNMPGVGNDYTGALAPSFTLIPTDPLVLSADGVVDFSTSLLADPLGSITTSLTTSSSTVKQSLGVDVNQNGNVDFIKFKVDDFLLDENSLAFEFADENDPAAGIEITAASLMLSGLVADITTDPPFTIILTGAPLSTIPLPSTFWLFAPAFLGLLVFSRRKMST